MSHATSKKSPRRAYLIPYTWREGEDYPRLLLTVTREATAGQYTLSMLGGHCEERLLRCLQREVCEETGTVLRLPPEWQTGGAPPVDLILDKTHIWLLPFTENTIAASALHRNTSTDSLSLLVRLLNGHQFRNLGNARAQGWRKICLEYSFVETFSLHELIDLKPNITSWQARREWKGADGQARAQQQAGEYYALAASERELQLWPPLDQVVALLWQRWQNQANGANNLRNKEWQRFQERAYPAEQLLRPPEEPAECQCLIAEVQPAPKKPIQTKSKGRRKSPSPRQKGRGQKNHRY